MTTTARRAVTTEPQDARAVLLGIAENLWSTLLDLNASDVHGVEALAIQRDDLPYGQVHNALLGVIIPLVDGDAERAARVRDLLSDNMECVAYNLDVEAGERAAAARAAEASEYASLLGWTEDEGEWLADFMEDNITMRAACGEPFADAYDVRSHELTCGACQGAKEADRAAFEATRA